MKRILLSLFLALVIPVFTSAQQDSAGQSVLLQNAATTNANGTTISTARWNGLSIKVIIASTATVNFERQTDGTNWDAFLVTNTADDARVSTTTATGAFIAHTGGAPVRARISGCSGCTVTVRATQYYTTAIYYEGGEGGGTPGGSDTQLQRNNAGAFGGISGATSDGTSVTYSSGNLIATRPKFTTSIDDTGGNELFILTAAASAVNEFTVANAATGNPPSISASGGDSNIDILFVPKGSGDVVLMNGANGQTLHIYGSYTDGSNNIKLSLFGFNNSAQIALTAAGSFNGAEHFYISNQSSTGHIKFEAGGAERFSIAPSVINFELSPRFNAGNTTGAGAALLGSNSPASTLTAPYVWIEARAADGSVVYLPAWK